MTEVTKSNVTHKLQIPLILPKVHYLVVSVMHSITLLYCRVYLPFKHNMPVISRQICLPN